MNELYFFQGMEIFFPKKNWFKSYPDSEYRLNPLSFVTNIWIDYRLIICVWENHYWKIEEKEQEGFSNHSVLPSLSTATNFLIY